MNVTDFLDLELGDFFADFLGLITDFLDLELGDFRADFFGLTTDFLGLDFGDFLTNFFGLELGDFRDTIFILYKFKNIKQKNIMVWIASFDIGKNNFAFYIEEFDENIEIDNINKNIRYKIDGSCTEQFNEILDGIYMNGKSILLQNVSLTNNCDKKLYLDTETFYNMTKILDKYENYWNNCDIILIEQQMSFGKQHNTMAIKLAQHCWSYFSIKYGKTKEIIEYQAYYKTQILGAAKITKTTKTGKISYKPIDKPARKKWCIQQATTILTTRCDNACLSIIKLAKKKDDLCDVICQCVSFVYLRFVDKSI